MRETRLRRATKDDRDAVVRVLVRAFDRDPVVSWMFRGDALRAWAFETGFDVAFRRLTLPAGETWLAGDGPDATGAALWTPPGGWSTVRALPSLPRLARAVGVARGVSLLRAVLGVQDHHPKVPHWYLFALGVDPDSQGRGIGSALLREVLARADAQRQPAYLEASTPMNARLYERHGFRVVAEVTMAPGAPPIWPMVREART